MIRDYKTEYKTKIVSTYGEPTTLDELFEMVKNIMAKRLGQARMIGFAWNIKYSNKVSCSHNSPVGELNNWSGKENRPTVFPGFTGRVWIRTANEPTGWLSDKFEHTLTYPGTGGGGAYNGPWKSVSGARFQLYGNVSKPVTEKQFPPVRSWSWDYKIFSKDFPLIVEEYTKSTLFDAIDSGNHPPIVIESNRTWTDDKTAKEDARFIEWATRTNGSSDPFYTVKYNKELA